jgi:hypothetical protein
MATTDDRIRNRRTFRRPMLWLGLAMTITYIGLGSLLLLNKSFLPAVSVEFRNIFATMLIVYGVFRGWRVYQDYF